MEYLDQFNLVNFYLLLERQEQVKLHYLII
jgi:hypothetical protein